MNAYYSDPDVPSAVGVSLLSLSTDSSVISTLARLQEVEGRALLNACVKRENFSYAGPDAGRGQ